MQNITLLIHPWISKITHHTPVLELLILVCISAVVVRHIMTYIVGSNKKLSAVSKANVVVEDEHD
ncbi:hypothetical protein [Mucilaginibacter paludis]|uniref:Uncharacterized protein n=1 Tax=Mucilaginibacter paludis DSM 18603 TaxID=714943 RepID=H1YA54_9SPHI|nr:hypothetical protein [Mucilaginibacter paludis]EHQ25935.1 hypothetical protein Mucpa_1781 [Mucilaginibacter paludis DSM 18603]